MKKSIWIVFSFLMILILSACDNNTPEVTDEPNQREQNDDAVEVDSNVGSKAEGEQKVTVDLKNREGASIGTAELVAKNDGVKISLRADHLTPGKHGIHIHETGLCEPPDFKSAGGHFNPFDKNHGFDDPKGPHAGDLPNITVNEAGTVEETFVNELVTLEKGLKNSLFNKEGTALIIHSKADDYVSQPSGDAGERIACGVISEPVQ